MAKKQWNRREFLKTIGGGVLSAAAFDPVLMMVEQIFNSKARQAMAGTTRAGIRNFVYVTQYGAPSRWTYDLLLNPYANPGSTSLPTVYPNQNLKTAFVPGTATDGSGWTLDYKTYLYKTPGGSTINLPYFWSGKMPTPTGSTALTNLAANALFVRGVAMPNDSHQTNQSKLLSPASAEPTLPSLYQRYANELISNPAATSSMSNILVPISKTNYPVRQGSLATSFNKVQDSVNAVLNQMAKEAQKGNSASSTLYDLHKSVDSSLNQNFFGNLDSLVAAYNTALDKYNALFDACAVFENYPVTGYATHTKIANTAPTGAIVNPLTGSAMNPHGAISTLGLSPMTNADLSSMIVSGGEIKRWDFHELSSTVCGS